MAIKKIKLPDNTTEDINDPRLPVVTTTDDGKVLSVIGGLWAKRVSSDFVHTSGNETIAGTKTFTSDVEINDIISTENGDDYPEGFDWIQDYGGSSLQDALDAKSEFSGSYDDLTNKPSSLPASDVSAWAKASSKPSYTFSEIGSTPTSLGGYGITNWLVQSTTASLDSLTTAGVYKLSSQATPYGGYGNLFVIHGAGDTLAQMYFPYDADAVFFRRGTTSNFTSNTWQHLYHSGNSNKSDVNWACNNLNVNGSIGIGVSPSYKIHFEENSDTTWTPNIYLKGARSSVTMLPGAGAGIRINSDRNVWNYWLLDCKSSSATVLYVRADGRVGVMTDSPSDTFHVVGNIVASGTITPGSDSRIKDNQKEISSERAFSVMENLKPKTWVWNKKSDEKLDGKSAAGLVAQEVKEILPDAVAISESGGIKDFHSLNYNTIQGYEIAAIKGLIEEVKSLKAEIAELKKQIK